MAINFTAENQARLGALVLEAFYGKTIFRGAVGTELSIFDLYHNTSVNTLINLHGATKKEVQKIEEMDEWTLTDHYKRKLKELQSKQELLSLLIGNARYQQELSEKAAQLKDLKADYLKLKEDNKTPEQKMKETEEKILAMGGNLN